MSTVQDTSRRLSAELRHEAGRLARHPIREVVRLERVADAGESAATLAILLAGLALVAWTLVALLVGLVLAAVAID